MAPNVDVALPASLRQYVAMTRCTARLFIAALAILVCRGLVSAETVGGPVRQDSGPLRELSTHAGSGSRPVRAGAIGLRDGNAGSLSGHSVRGSVTGDVVSGPVREISGGPVTSGLRSSGRRTVTDVSAGAVTKDIDSPLREVVGAPVSGLGQLQQRLRRIEPLPREATLPLEPAPNGGEALPDEATEGDLPEADRQARQPSDHAEHDAEALQAATESADLAAQDSDERQESDDADQDQWPEVSAAPEGVGD